MSLIEVKHIQDIANETMREIAEQEKIDKKDRKRMQALRDPNYKASSSSGNSDYQENLLLTNKERYEKRMNNPSGSKRIKGITYM